MLSTDAILQSVLRWARGENNVLAVIQTGSTARADGRKDQFSDLDLEIIAEKPQRLTDSDAWFAAQGDVWVTLRFNDVDHPTRLVIYDGGVKVDYTIAGPNRLATMREQLDPLYDRGFRVLLDKRGLSAGLPAPSGGFSAAAPPTQTEFIAVVEEFWFEATHMPRYLAREDLWVVKFRDWTMKEDLLQMLEWHAAATSAKPVDSLYIGTRMKEWVDPNTWDQLHQVFGRFDPIDSWRSLLKTTELFTRLSREVAERLRFSYSQDLAERVQGYLDGFAPQAR